MGSKRFHVFRRLLSCWTTILMDYRPLVALVSPSGGFLSLLCDQGLHFASIKLCLALSHQGAIIKIPVIRCHCLWCLGAQYIFFFCQLNVSILTEALIPDSKQQLKQLEKFRRGFEITIPRRWHFKQMEKWRHFRSKSGQTVISSRDSRVKSSKNRVH